MTRLRFAAQAMGNCLKAMHLRDQVPFSATCYAD